MNLNSFRVYDISHGIYRPNLVGVFSKQFPLVCSSVIYYKRAQTVSYYGKDYVISFGGFDEQ